MRELDFFIVGAMKSGTTTLFDDINGHEQIFMPVEKEPFYYVWKTEEYQFKLPSTNGFASIDRWKIFTTEQKYNSLFDKAKEDQLCGEASTFYLPHMNAAEEIKKEHPRSKIIIILRDPVSRAYSAYNFQCSFGLEPEQSFEKAIRDEKEGNRDEWLYGWRYLYCSSYYEQVKKYYEVFGKERILVLTQEQLRNERQESVNSVCEFLGVDSIKVNVKNNSNVTSVPSGKVGKLVKYMFSRPSIIKDSVKGFIPISIRRKIKSNVMNQVAKYSAKPERIDKYLEEELKKYFKKDVENLGTLIGKDLSKWYLDDSSK